MTRAEFEKTYVNFEKINMSEEEVLKIKNLLMLMDDYDKCKKQSKESLILNRDSSISDIEDLFLIFKYCYSAYDYYSKQINFDDIKNNIIEKINEDITNTNLAK